MERVDQIVMYLHFAYPMGKPDIVGVMEMQVNILPCVSTTEGEKGFTTYLKTISSGNAYLSEIEMFEMTTTFD